MAFTVRTDIAYGNACEIEVEEHDKGVEIRFAPAPHGGPECLWFCFRVENDDAEDRRAVRLVLKHTDNMLGGHEPTHMHPVVKPAQEDWGRLGGGDIVELPDGRKQVAWTLEAVTSYVDVAYCYPYGVPDIEALVLETGDYWHVDTIGVSQASRPLLRLSNAYGHMGAERPGLYLVARQHAGETPGSWVLDGFLRHIATLGDRAPLVWAVPLTNIDGVENGDYGKDNFPYDLNRAWGRPPMRHEVLVFQRDMARWAQRCTPVIGLDFHAPGACEMGGIYAYVPDPSKDQARHQAAQPWAEAVAKALGPEYAADPFSRVATYPSRWETPHFTTYCWYDLGVNALTFETSYALVGDQVLTRARYREAGVRIAEAVVGLIK